MKEIEPVVIELDFETELKKGRATIASYFDQKKLPTSCKSLFEALSDDDVVMGKLPVGFIYCMACAPSRPFFGLVRFFMYGPGFATGNCVVCGKKHQIRSNGELITFDSGKPDIILGPVSNDDLWNHVKGMLRRSNDHQSSGRPEIT